MTPEQATRFNSLKLEIARELMENIKINKGIHAKFKTTDRLISHTALQMIEWDQEKITEIMKL